MFLSSRSICLFHSRRRIILPFLYPRLVMSLRNNILIRGETISPTSQPPNLEGRGVTLTPHPLLVPWSRKGGAISPLPLWTVRSVQSLSACTRVHFTLHFYFCSPRHQYSELIYDRHNFIYRQLHYETHFKRQD
jgi:hypothetical protein